MDTAKELDFFQGLKGLEMRRSDGGSQGLAGWNEAGAKRHVGKQAHMNRSAVAEIIRQRMDGE